VLFILFSSFFSFSRVEYKPTLQWDATRTASPATDPSDPLDLARLTRAKHEWQQVHDTLKQHWVEQVLDAYRFGVIHCIREFTYYPQIVEV
jgi:hypothetical protein